MAGLNEFRKRFTGRAERKPLGRSEMRKQLLGVFLPLLVMVLLASAETQNTGTETSMRSAVQKVDVVRVNDGIQVEITAHGQMIPSLTTLDRPARVVLDLPNTVAATAQSRIAVGSDGVKSVRIGMDGQMPPTTRVVVDLAQACRYELVPSADHKVVLKLYSTSSTAKLSPKPTTAPVSSPVKTAAAATKPVAKAAPVVTADAKRDASASPFVFVEPS